MKGSVGQFHTTRWTLVMASARDQSQTGRAALAALCQISDPAEIEGEVRALRDALIATEGRLKP